MTDTPDAPARDYRDTVFLPKTDFPMKAGLPQKEPAILAKWEADGMYARLREARAGREKFILHDGPPYANGDMHIGHALNHILKDMVCRTQSLLGRDAPYVPGWDCHGLPIEWKVEEQYRKKKLNKDEVPVKEFRAECRAYAQHWVNVQREQVKRLGVLGHWDKPYLTMDFDSEATIVSELLKFAGSGQLYRGAKPVMWSPVEKTALAEAEIEYEDIVSTQIDAAFEVSKGNGHSIFPGQKVVIWTTTPWTIPVNQAVAYNPDLQYVLIDFSGPDASDEYKSLTFFVARDLVPQVTQRLGELFEGSGRWGMGAGIYMGRDFAGVELRHPMNDLGGFFAKPRPMLPGDFVTADSGTGFVHMAPDHGEDDFELCKAHGIEPQFAVEGDGKYRADWGWLGGQGSVINPKFNAPDGPICAELRAAGGLLAASADYKHSYPHSWRSKAKVIYRCTPQWFVPMDHMLPSPPAGGEGQTARSDVRERGESSTSAAQTSPSPSLAALAFPSPPEGGEGETLRSKAMSEIERVRWVPEKGQNRIRSMVEGRPDWVLSRQRAWGVPITLFVDRKTGQYLNDAGVNARIVEAIKAEGVDAWEGSRAQEYLGSAYAADDYEQIFDILDVWFDSGCTHVFTLESGKWPELSWPADLYLEGSDQHRGWFQSSLLQSTGTRGRAPYDAVLTHGFTMDQKGMKMSKSVGNTVDPLKVMETSGADIIRLWALSVDFTEDHRIGDEILKGVGDQYRKLRNTFRYLLGALEGFEESERVDDVSAMPELERYMLHLLSQLDATLKQAVLDYDFNTYVRALTDFCNEDLSAFFFDIRKDSLYCDIGPAAPLGTDKRRAYRTVLDTLFHALVRYAAPVLVFTAEEVWGTRYPDGGSVHLLEWPVLPELPVSDIGNLDLDGVGNLVRKWNRIRSTRATLTEAIEPLRRDKVIKSGLEAHVEWPVTLGDLPLPSEDLAEVAIVASISSGAFDLAVTRTTHQKCGRCWRHLPEVTADGALCNRCETVLASA